MQRCLCYILLLVAGLTHATFAQSASPFTRLDSATGLSHNTILSIYQDRLGFLWIGTSDGLNRYDGYSVQVYRHDPVDSTSLSHNTIKHIVEDKQGNLWIGTGDGLNRFDRARQTFERITMRKERTEREDIYKMLEARDGTLWVVSSSLYQYNPENKELDIKEFTPGHSDVFEDTEGQIWVVHDSGTLGRYRPETKDFHVYPLSQGSMSGVQILWEDDGYFWLGHQQGLIRWHRDTETVHPMPWVSSLYAYHPRDLLQDDEGLLWFGTSEGLYRADPERQTVTRVTLDTTPGAYLANNIWTLYQDQVGALWVGTLNGLYHGDPQTKPFRHHTWHPTDPSSISNNTVMGLTASGDDLWVGTLGGGLNRIHRPTNTVTRVQANTTVCNALVWSLLADPTGTIWMGTEDGVCAYQPAQQRWTAYPVPRPAGLGEAHPIYDLHHDHRGRIWVGGYDLYYRDPQDTAWRILSIPRNPGTFTLVELLYPDRRNRLWVSIFGGRLYRLDLDTDEIVQVPVQFNESTPLVTEGIWAMHEDAAGRLWLGSDLGLTHFDPDEERVLAHYAPRDGLPGSIVYGILPDADGHLWLSTNRGLARFDPQGAPKFRVFDQGDGVPISEFNRRAAFVSADGQFYFGGLEGLVSFDPTAIGENPHRPPVVLTRIQKSNQDSTTVINPHGLTDLTLSYRDYTFSFEFAALNFTYPTKNQYAYQLEGFDDDWIQAGTRRFATYTNIPPGQYTFRVKASNNDGLWNQVGYTLPLRIVPLFWQTWWFRLLIVLLLVILLLLFYRYRIAQILQIERMRYRIASDLHDDIGSKLSGIALMSEMIHARTALPTDEARQLTRIGTVARDMVGALRDIVWFISPDHDHTEDLIERMKQEAQTMLNGLTWTFTQPDKNLPDNLPIAVRRNLFLIYKEALHNIVRHAEAQHVDIQLAYEKGQCRLAVKDDGVGFEAEAARDQGQGLKNMHYRATQLKGTLNLQTAPQQGTTLHLHIPLNNVYA